MPQPPRRAEIANDRSTLCSNPTHRSRKHTTHGAQAALILKTRHHPTKTTIKAVCTRHFRPRTSIKDPHLQRVLHVTQHHPRTPNQPRPRPNRRRIHLSSSTPTHPINIHQQPDIEPDHQHAKPHTHRIPLPNLLRTHPRIPPPTPIRAPSLPNTNNTNPPKTHHHSHLPFPLRFFDTLPPAPATKTLAKRLHSLRALHRLLSHGRPHLPVPFRGKHDATHGVRTRVWE